MNAQQHSELMPESAGSNNPADQQISITATIHPKAEASSTGNARVNDVKSFFTKDLLQIIKAIFLEPIKGTLSIFTSAGNDAYKQALILIATTALFYIIIPYLMVGSEIRSVIGFGVFLKFGICAGLVLLIVSCLTFGIKAISGKPDFKKELLTGGLCGIPLMLLLLVVAVFMLFNKDNISLLNPSSLLQQGMISGIIFLYLVLMLFNIVQQSFKASGTNDALSWYLSPLVICIGFYIGGRIAMEIFGPAAGFGRNSYY